MNHKKILFASMPLDGHFSPLTSLAMHLKEAGHDIRWYTGRIYAAKLSSLGITHYPFQKALEANQYNIDEIFPERTKIKNGITKLKFDLRNSFILRCAEFYEDILDLKDQFDFDLMICDIAFTAIPFVREKMHKPVIAIGVFPIGETSRDLAPNGTAIAPSTSFLGRKKQDLLRFVANKVLFNRENKLINSIFDTYGIEKIEGNLFDILYRKSNLVLQSGSPGFEYKRSDLSKNIRFIGPVLPYSSNRPTKFGENDKLRRYKKVILVTQGTVEKDTRKIIEPTLKAFAGSEYLVVATTGGSNTSELKNKYKYDNIIIEDFIPFTEIMPFANVFITNGGYGGVMLGIEHGLPLVVAGIHEGKNEINARIGHFELGRNLKTETPTPQQIKKNVERVLSNPRYRYNVQNLGEELSGYNPNELCDKYIAQLMQQEENSTLSLFNNQKVA